MRSFLVVPVLLAAAAAGAAEPAARTTIVPPGTERSYEAYHYAPAVKVGDMVIVSGVPALRGETYEAKIRGMFEHVKQVLAAAGAEMADVVEITTFHVQPKDTPAFEKEFEEFLKVHKEFFPSHYPAWTAVGTTALLASTAPVEMRVVAMIGSGRNAKMDRPVAKTEAKPGPAPAEPRLE